MGKKQTAIEFLINELYHYGGTMRINNGQMVIYFPIEHFEYSLKKAKQVEKDRMAEYAIKVSGIAKILESKLNK
jgi:hypothetical protein